MLETDARAAVRQGSAGARSLAARTSGGAGDRFPKRRRYREAGVPLYWVVDGAERSVEIWTPLDDFPMVERERLGWRPPGAHAPFTLSLEELFRPL